MTIKAEETKDFIKTTRIQIFLDDGTTLAEETFMGTGWCSDKKMLLSAIKHTLRRHGMLLGNDLDSEARLFHSTADVVSDDVYRIVDLLNYSMKDFIAGTADVMYFRKIPNAGVAGGIYRQIIADISMEKIGEGDKNDECNPVSYRTGH